MLPYKLTNDHAIYGSNVWAAKATNKRTRTADMIDPNDPLKDGLTPPDFDEYGDVPESGENTEPEAGTDPKDEPNPGESPLG